MYENSVFAASFLSEFAVDGDASFLWMVILSLTALFSKVAFFAGTAVFDAILTL